MIFCSCEHGFTEKFRSLQCFIVYNHRKMFDVGGNYMVFFSLCLSLTLTASSQTHSRSQ